MQLLFLISGFGLTKVCLMSDSTLVFIGFARKSHFQVVLGPFRAKQYSPDTILFPR